MSLFKGCNDTARAYLTISVESAVHNNPNTLSPGQTTASPYLTSCWQGSVTKCLQNCLQSILRGRNTSPCGGAARLMNTAPWGAPAPAVLPRQIRVFGHNLGRGQMADSIFVMQN